MDYRYGNRMVFKIKYHFVWVMTYLYPVRKRDAGERVRELVKAARLEIIRECRTGRDVELCRQQGEPAMALARD